MKFSTLFFCHCVLCRVENIYKNFVNTQQFTAQSITSASTSEPSVSISTALTDSGCHSEDKSGFTKSQVDASLPNEVISNSSKSVVDETLTINVNEQQQQKQNVSDIEGEPIIQPNLPQELPPHNDTIDLVLDMSETMVRDLISNLNGNVTFPNVEPTNELIENGPEDKAEQHPRKIVSQPTQVNPTNKRKRRTSDSAARKSVGNPKKKPKLAIMTHKRESHPSECEICGREFHTKSEFYEHMTNHGRVFSFKCSICCEKFSNEENWKSHENGCKLRKFHCYACKKRFPNRSSLVQHFLTHTGDKPFACKVCHTQFTTKSNLNRHKQSDKHKVMTKQISH